MKKYQILIILILALSVVFAGCKAIEEEEVSENLVSGEEIEPVEKIDTIEDYFPFKENTIMEYEGIGNEFAEQETFFEFIEEIEHK